MQLLPKPNKQTLEKTIQLQNQQKQIRQELRQRIYAALQDAKALSADDCVNEIRDRLSAIQTYCKSVEKTFILVEEKITCDQYELGGCDKDTATLFRGPSEDASVAICVTTKGSLLHRNGHFWEIYRNAGDTALR